MSPATTERPSPWTVQYADGSANVYRFTQSSPGAEVELEYVPVTPEMSSTGSYSGGEPHQARLAPTDPRLDELWTRVERLQADTSLHTPDRAKMTGAFSIETPSGRRQFVIVPGPALEDLHTFMTGFRPSL